MLRKLATIALLLFVCGTMVAACGDDVPGEPAAANSLIPETDAVETLPPTLTLLPSATAEPAATATPQPTNTRVLPYTPIATADPNQPARADVARISVNEAKAQVEAGQAIFVDVRSEISYDQLRIEGATLMPSNEVVERYDELPADKLVIFYCA
ncbi:MAG: rhodanese-like domain-containing protein [Anaerolineae bacterium]